MQCDFNQRILPHVGLENLLIENKFCLVLGSSSGSKTSISTDRGLNENANDEHTCLGVIVICIWVLVSIPSNLFASRMLASWHLQCEEML